MTFNEAITALGKAYGHSAWNSAMGGGTGRGHVEAERILEIIFGRKMTEHNRKSISRIAREEEKRIDKRYRGTGLEPGH